MIFAEIAQREAIQVPAVRGIAKRAEIGVVGCNDKNAATRRRDAVEFFDRADDVGDMFDHVNGADFPESVIAKRKRIAVEICDDIRARVRIAIDADATGIFVDAAADIENGKLPRSTRGLFAGVRAQPGSSCRHCSSVSTAKST